MKSVIYCFSGTGNSLYIARKVGKQTNAQVKLINQRVVSEGEIVTADVVGIVFPVYHQGLPNIVREFAHSVEFTDVRYLYAIVTYGSKPTLALKYFNDLLMKNGRSLDNGFGVQMPYNYVRPTKIGKGFYKSFKLANLSLAKRKKVFEKAELRITNIINSIQEMETGKYAVSDVLIESVVDFFRLRDSIVKSMWLKGMNYNGPMPEDFVGAIKLMDSVFIINEKCTSCGLCKKACPAGNIEYVDGIPDFKNNCEQCFRCIAFCPENAIILINDKDGIPYHHPEINLKDFLRSD